MIMRIILLVLIFGPILSAAELPTLRFDDQVTWKQIFDFGFRPKHLEGLERTTCVCLEQSFWLQFRNDRKFKLESGRLAFAFSYDDFLQMVWHQGTEPITLAEGKNRADAFRQVFDGYIIQEITMPTLIDPSGLVDAGNDENNVKARVGKYLIWYGFDNSLGKDKPIIPHFYISWGFPGMPDVRRKDSGDVVRPPKGYEWYSLDPKVSTPDLGSTPGTLPTPEVKVPGKDSSAQPKIEAKSVQPEKPKVIKNDSRWQWWLIGILGFIIAAVLVWRWK
jgi:hypothetical protein